MSLFAPLTAVFVSAAFVAVAIAWRSDRYAAKPMTPIFACTGAWGFLELMAAVEPEANGAIVWLRWIALPALLLGPATVALLAHMVPTLKPRLSSSVRWGTVLAVAGGVVAGLVPHSIERIEPTIGGGWLPVYGQLMLAMIVMGSVLPIGAGWLALRSAALAQNADISEDERRFLEREKMSAWGLAFVVCISLAVGFLTELVFPVWAIPVPRLGAVWIASTSAVTWLGVLFASGDLFVTSNGLARTMLRELHDAVVLIQLDGTIVSVNPRFEEMANQPSAALLGASLSDWVDLPAERFCVEFEDQEVVLSAPQNISIPLSMSSTVTRDPSGGVTGAVIVLRDLSEIESLRRSLLSSGRLAAIGELAAGIAHEVNNPVAFVRSDLNLLARRLHEIGEHIDDAALLDSTAVIFSRGEERIRKAREATDYVAQVVGDVRGFAHLGGRGQGGSEPVPLLEVALRLAGMQRGGEVGFAVRRAECSERISYGQELKQILVSLLRAVVDAAEAGAQVDVSMESDSKMLLVDIRAAPLTGSPSALVSRFEAAGSKMEEAEGSEVELAIAAGLVAELGGTIAAESALGDRVQVRVALPLDAGEGG